MPMRVKKKSLELVFLITGTYKQVKRLGLRKCQKLFFFITDIQNKSASLLQKRSQASPACRYKPKSKNLQKQQFKHKYYRFVECTVLQKVLGVIFQLAQTFVPYLPSVGRGSLRGCEGGRGSEGARREGNVGEFVRQGRNPNKPFIWNFDKNIIDLSTKLPRSEMAFAHFYKAD